MAMEPPYEHTPAQLYLGDARIPRKEPIHRGVVVNWDDLEHIFRLPGWSGLKSGPKFRSWKTVSGSWHWPFVLKCILFCSSWNHPQRWQQGVRVCYMGRVLSRNTYHCLNRSMFLIFCNIWIEFGGSSFVFEDNFDRDWTINDGILTGFNMFIKLSSIFKHIWRYLSNK